MARTKRDAGQDAPDKGDAKAKPPKRTPKKKPSAAADLTSLRKQVEEAKAARGIVEREADAVIKESRRSVQKARDIFRKTVAPYRVACRKAGEKCEYSTGRSSNVSTQVSFAVAKTKRGIRVMVKGQPQTEEVISFATLKKSLNRAAYAYSDKHLGPKEVVGNKGGSLSNRLRAVLK